MGISYGRSEWIVRDGIRMVITGGFGIPGENDNGRMVTDFFFSERGLCVVVHISRTRVCISTPE